MLFRIGWKNPVTVESLEEGASYARRYNPTDNDDESFTERDRARSLASFAYEISLAKDPTTIYEVDGGGKIVSFRPA